MKKLLMVITAVSLAAFSCTTGKDVVCTQEYRMLTVSISDSLARPVVLDYYYVKKTATGEVIPFGGMETREDSLNRTHGIYYIITDSQFGMTSQKGDEFVLYGFSGSIAAVTEKYLLGNDRCHVLIRSGKTSIIVNLH